MEIIIFLSEIFHLFFVFFYSSFPASLFLQAPNLSPFTPIPTKQWIISTIIIMYSFFDHNLELSKTHSASHATSDWSCHGTPSLFFGTLQYYAERAISFLPPYTPHSPSSDAQHSSVCVYSSTHHTHTIPTTTHHVTLIFKVLNLFRGQSNLTTTRDTLVLFDKFCHCIALSSTDVLTKSIDSNIIDDEETYFSGLLLIFPYIDSGWGPSSESMHSIKWEEAYHSNLHSSNSFLECLHCFLWLIVGPSLGKPHS